MIKLEVTEGKVPWITGIIGILFGVLLLFFSIGSGTETGTVTLFIALVAVAFIGAGALLCLDGKNRRLTVEDDRICYRRWNGREIRFCLEEIGYCKTALENRGNGDYLTIYDVNGKKLCKLEYNMRDSILFLQYLLDNQIRVECTERSSYYLQCLIGTGSVRPEEMPGTVNACLEEARALVSEWEKRNQRFRAEWKLGIAVYLEHEFDEKKQLWEQEGYDGIQDGTGSDIRTVPIPDGRQPDLKDLPEGYTVVIEGYLQKDGAYVIDRKNQAVMIATSVINLSRSMQIGKPLVLRYFGNTKESLAEQLETWERVLPKQRYHTEMLTLQHELRQKL